ncbi:hypothetical protein [Ramlibacter sp.]|uniref:hypothetical protein n=1 Tax=Ramlibacter sp. TaxID=1917967 RepID=UPI002626DA6B|nr:hypothetical protein [Ramlibacter sp.]
MRPAAHHVVARSPTEFGDREIDDFVAFVLAAGEVSPVGLRDRVMRAHTVAFLRRDECLLGVAGLKRPEPSYRARVAKSAGLSLPREEFEFELGWIFILPSARGTKLSFPLCEPVIQAAGDAGIFATSRASNTGMHVTLKKLGFSRKGAEWPSKQVDENLQLFVNHAV